MATKIKAKKDLYNNGKCFTKGQIYEVEGDVYTLASLMDMRTVNDMGEPHIIGTFWREFKLV